MVKNIFKPLFLLGLLVLVPEIKAEPMVSDSLQTDSLVTGQTVNREKKGLIKILSDYFANSNKKPITNKLDFSIIGGPHYSSDTKLGIGIIAAGVYRTDMQDTLLPPSNLSLYSDFSTVGFYMFGLRGTHIFPRDRFRFNYNTYFYSFPSYFWGTGYEMGRNDDNKSKYSRFQAQVKADFMFHLGSNFFAGPLLQLDYVDAHKIDRPELWNGERKSSFNSSVGVAVQYDSRDYLTDAHRGYYLRVEQRFSPAFMGNKMAFSTTMLQTSYYYPVWKGGVLAAQLRGNINYGDVPWGLMAVLGGSYSMRGYYEGRYRDKCSVDTQVELRQKIWKRNGIAIWAGAGEIFPKFSEFRMKNILPNYGVGYRWEFKSRMNIRLDLGFGKGQTGFIFNINEAF